MREKYARRLERVSVQLDSMVEQVRTAIHSAGEALLTRNPEIAQQVIDNDSSIDALQISIIDQCMEILAKQSPVATDLRVVVSTLRLASLYERMGDLARHIAEIAQRHAPEPAVPQIALPYFEKLQHASEHVMDKICLMTDTFDDMVAESIIHGDDEIDNLDKEIIKLPSSDRWEGSPESVIDLVLLARYYERFGDHAVSAARRVLYIVSGFNPSKMPESNAHDVE